MLNKKEKILLHKLLMSTEQELSEYLVGQLCKYYDKVETFQRNIFAYGEIPVTLVAHMDTVFKELPKDLTISDEGIIYAEAGLGADDRAGIFAILNLLEGGYRPSVLFTVDEEVGCLGAKAFIKKYPNPPTETKFLIQLDRSGKEDCVFYDCGNSKFHTYIEKFGFVTGVGSFSDISILCPQWNVAGVNLSIGYYYEHTKFEHLSTIELIETIKKVRLILNNVKNNSKMKPYPNKTVKKLWDWARENDADFCFKCKVAHPLYNMMPVKVNGITREFCADCYYETFVFCDVCGKLMVRVPDSEYNICPKCKRGE